MKAKINMKKLVTSIAIPVIGGGVLGFVATKSAKKEYKQLKQPSFAPPGWVFPVTWTTLYITMGVAKYIFNKESKSKKLERYGNAAYSSQLGFNFLWSFLFFRWNLRGTALMDAVLLWTATSLTTYYFYQKSKPAAMLMVPYIGWTTFAVGLNYSVWQLNRTTIAD